MEQKKEKTLKDAVIERLNNLATACDKAWQDFLKIKNLDEPDVELQWFALQAYSKQYGEYAYLCSYYKMLGVIEPTEVEI